MFQLSEEESKHAANIVAYKAEQILLSFQNEGYSIEQPNNDGWFKLTNEKWQMNVNIFMPDDEDKYMFYFETLPHVKVKTKLVMLVKDFKDFNQLMSFIHID